MFSKINNDFLLYSITLEKENITMRRSSMKKYFATLFIVLILGLGMSVNSMAATLSVGSGQTYSTIAAAITAAGDGTGDIISVEDATHTEEGITVSKSLTIQGQGAQNTIVQAHATQGSDRVFTISSGKTVALKNMTIRNGKTDIGGGINNSGTLTLMNCTVSGNSATYIGSFKGGGGINNSDSGTLTLTNCTVSGNSANTYAGGIKNFGTMTLTNCTVSGNTASSNCGAMDLEVSVTTLTNCTIANNSGG